ncbi:RNA-binding S4 domain-containing protein [Eupransor demetentiae]|uniref:RQC P-site tRNA stabilizing factor n=1 Tax=Eupransor demetentiae TaxID=3109584 RepID=A0ABP0EQL5_9LACO|nr:Ribosomal 50S subunit-recycling heat shock protein [Lactobacillaceae bacterium LMG 33000]
MRLDKFLKISRLVRRRTIAKEIADQGRIEINNKVAKSSANVGTGDLITIHFGNKTITVKVLKLAELVKKDEAGEMYELVKEEYERDFR